MKRPARERRTTEAAGCGAQRFTIKSAGAETFSSRVPLTRRTEDEAVMMEAVSLVSPVSARAGARMQSAHEITARARRGDEDAFRLIFERYSRPIISFIYDMVGRRDLAEELTQETFVRAYKNLSGLQDDAKLSTWLFGIAKNVARESLRTRHRDDQRVELDADGVSELRDDKLPPDRE